MSAQEILSAGKVVPVDRRSGFDYNTGIFHSLTQLTESFNIPTRHDLGTTEFVLSQFPSPGYAESKVALIDSVTGNRVTYSQLMHSVRSLSIGLYHALGVRKGDVVFVLSPNCLLYPTICLAVLSLGAVLTTANPLNTESEIAKQVYDSEAKLGIASPDELFKLTSLGLPTLVTTKSASLSVEDLIECCDSTDLELPLCELTQLDSAAILYSSGTTGVSKGVVLTHENFISVITLLKWSVYASSLENDVFLCLIPMFHIYGLTFLALGLFCSHITTVIMQKFDLAAMFDAVHTYQVGNIAAVPLVILGLVKNPKATASSLSSLRRMGTGAAPLSKELADRFRKRFPWIELRQGYGLTESTGAATFLVADEDAKRRQGSSGRLLPTFSAKVVEMETRNVLASYGKGELWMRGPAIMRGYLKNEVATHATMDSDRWLKTGDLCYFDEDGFVYIVDRIKELIKHNRYQDQKEAMNHLESENKKLISKCTESKQTIEKKMEEILAEFRKSFEDQIRVLSRQIQVAEQLHLENREVYRKTKEKFENEDEVLKEQVVKTEIAFKKMKDISLWANNTLSGMDVSALKFEESCGNFLNSISKSSCEIVFARDWVRRKRIGAKHSSEENECLLEQLHGKENEILKYKESVWKLEHRNRELEKIVKEKEEGIVALGEEKREAIRQLCVWIDYHRSSKHHLEKIIVSEMSKTSSSTFKNQ